MKRKLLILIILNSNISIVFSQFNLPKQWDYRYGGPQADYLQRLITTRDGGFILAGISQSDSGADKSHKSWDPSLTTGDFWVVKLDSLGIKQWDRTYGGSGNEKTVSVEETKDGGYIIGGESNSGISGDKTQTTIGNSDFWIIKTDGQGIKQWDKRYAGPGGDQLTSLKPTTDGGYILGGRSQSTAGYDKTDPMIGNYGDYWVVKIDSVGVKQWDKTYGGTGIDYLETVLQTSDGGYIFGGSISSTNDGTVSQPNWNTSTNYSLDYWVIKTDALGNKQWDKRFGGTGDEYFVSMQQTKDGGYILGGQSSSGVSGDRTQPMMGGKFDFWVVKINAQGIQQWDKRYGGTESEEKFGNIFQTRDGGFMMAGSSFSDIGGEKSENNMGPEQTWIVKTDSAGKIEWDRTLLTRYSFSPHDEQGLAVETRDGYAFANHTRSDTGGYKTQFCRGGYDFWIIKYGISQQCQLEAPSIASNKNLFCANDSAQICAPAGYFSYQWNTGEMTSCIYTRQAGNYYVTVSDPSNCSVESNRIAVAVHPQPPVSIVVNGDTLSSFGAEAYQWYFNGNKINGATSAVYVANQQGSYTLEITDANGCKAMSTSVLISGIEELEEGAVSIYPNPCLVENVQLTINKTLLGGSMEVYDNNGRLVFHTAIRHPSTAISLPVSPGVYFIHIHSDKTSITKKFIRL